MDKVNHEKQNNILKSFKNKANGKVKGQDDEQ